jgi:hypothetical protein
VKGKALVFSAATKTPNKDVKLLSLQQQVHSALRQPADTICNGIERSQEPKSAHQDSLPWFSQNHELY